MSRQTFSTVIDNLRVLREEAGLDRIELAYKAGVDISTIDRIEQGKTRSPRRATVEAIQNVLDREAVA